MFCRADVAAKLGIDGADITDLAAFRDVLVEVTDAKADRWGMVNNPLDYSGLMYSIQKNLAERSNGSLTSADENEVEKDELESVRELQKDGVMQPDMASTTPVKAAWKFDAGEGVCTWSSYTGYIGLCSTYYAANPAFASGMLQVRRYDGGMGIGWRCNLINNMVSITIDSKARIETLLEIGAWLAAPFGSEENLFQRYGIEGVHYSLTRRTRSPIRTRSPRSSIPTTWVPARTCSTHHRLRCSSGTSTRTCRAISTTPSSIRPTSTTRRPIRASRRSC